MESTMNNYDPNYYNPSDKLKSSYKLTLYDNIPYSRDASKYTLYKPCLNTGNLYKAYICKDNPFKVSE